MKKKEHLYEEAETYQKIKLGKSPKGERMLRSISY
jgi:hypothetical protein